MKVAVIHDWLTGVRGGEKVLEAILEIYPNADLYTLVYKKGSLNKLIEDRKIYTSFIDKLPFATKLYKHYNPLFPFAIEQFNLNKYDLVISSSHIAAKGVITGPNTLHISYIHTPVRYYWDRYDNYFRNKNFLMKLIIGFVAPLYRIWDVSNTNRIDHLIANSSFVSNRIFKYYKRKSTVIYPPVDTTKFNNLESKTKDYYLIVSALVPYKSIHIAIQAFNKNKKKLKIVGNGEEVTKLKHLSKSIKIEFLGRVSNEELNKLYSGAKGFIINSVEDFGIAPIEAQACGIPVIAYKKGGCLETIIENETGIFYDKQNSKDLNKAILELEKRKWNIEKIKDNSKRFSKEKFKQSLIDYIRRIDPKMV